MTEADIAVILRRLDEQDRSLGRIERKVDKTNGRVTKLETDKEVTKALSEEHAKDSGSRKTWFYGALAAVLGGAVSSLIIVLTGGSPH